MAIEITAPSGTAIVSSAPFVVHASTPADVVSVSTRRSVARAATMRWHADATSSNDSVTVTAGTVNAPTYRGSYAITPSESAQVLDTRGFLMGEDLTVAPIPNNYGLITWDGTVITVS